MEAAAFAFEWSAGESAILAVHGGFVGRTEHSAGSGSGTANYVRTLRALSSGHRVRYRLQLPSSRRQPRYETSGGDLVVFPGPCRPAANLWPAPSLEEVVFSEDQAFGQTFARKGLGRQGPCPYPNQTPNNRTPLLSAGLLQFPTRNRMGLLGPIRLSDQCALHEVSGAPRLSSSPVTSEKKKKVLVFCRRTADPTHSPNPWVPLSLAGRGEARQPLIFRYQLHDLAASGWPGKRGNWQRSMPGTGRSASAVPDSET